jgi:poly-gamma-glutamate capsule biosynthesis protein CapA/YwtB (metallophosphatase superfamily)
MDFKPMFASLKPVYESADLAVCHLEVPLAEPDGPFLNYPLFSAPPQVVNGLEKAGVDVCTTASNHSLDTGFEGLKRTLDTLDRKRVDHAGTARTRKESKTPLILDVAGTKVALLSYTYGTNGIPIPSEQPWSVPLIDPADIKRDARRARKDGAEVVVVALHHGTEYTTEPDSYQLDVVDAITRSKAIDLVYGHHAHVPQPIDVVHGTWVAYGLGNFVAQQSTDVPDTYRGVTVKFTFAEQPNGRFEVTRAQFVPTMITPYDGSPMRVLDIRSALRDPSTDPGLEPSLREALASIREDVYSLGARREGLRMMKPVG